MIPYKFLHISLNSAAILWRIHASEAVLLRDNRYASREQAAYKARTHPHKRKEWLATRLALTKLLTQLDYKLTELRKDDWGCPYLVDSPLHISLAHSSDYALVAISEQYPIGIDIQWPCQKLLHVKRKFLNDNESQQSGSDLEKLCIYWCAKEALYKMQGGRGLSLKDDICIEEFVKKKRGTVRGTVRKQLFAVHYRFYSGYVLAWTEARGLCEEYSLL